VTLCIACLVRAPGFDIHEISELKMNSDRSSECDSVNNDELRTSSHRDIKHLTDAADDTDAVCACDDDLVTTTLPDTLAGSTDDHHQQRCSCSDDVDSSNSLPAAASSSCVNDVNSDGQQTLLASDLPIPEAAAASGNSSDGFFNVDIDALIAHQRELLARVNSQRDEFIRQVEFVESEIEQAAERMTSAVDNRVNELLMTASEVRHERASQLDQLRNDVESRLVDMNQHHRVAEELLRHGSNVELVDYAPVLHANAQSICSQPVPEMPPWSDEARAKLAALEQFASLNVDELRPGVNLVGRLTVTTDPDMDGNQESNRPMTDESSERMRLV